MEAKAATTASLEKWSTKLGPSLEEAGMENAVRRGFVFKMGDTKIYILEDQAEANQKFYFHVILHIIP